MSKQFNLVDKQTQFDAFIMRLEAEAAVQAQLSRTKMVPGQLQGLAVFVVTHVWQVCMVLALLTAILVEFARYV